MLPSMEISRVSQKTKETNAELAPERFINTTENKLVTWYVTCTMSYHARVIPKSWLTGHEVDNYI